MNVVLWGMRCVDQVWMLVDCVEAVRLEGLERLKRSWLLNRLKQPEKTNRLYILKSTGDLTYKWTT